ncbi:hypothetical protein CBER1_07155 [Cercospora berteroae]|uniref:Uncharacterized protein n=1 Tax=Cercospora berteroae TaxID=357750 RepID=A0A2S6CFM9_9PEZI|nr:hypothetical protein CBER1_07155 [Cercospora berteroae]
MPMTKAFLDDIPREIQDEIYNVPIRKGQSPEALYHDTCIVMRGTAIDAEFTNCMSRFVPLHLKGFLERSGSEYRFEKDSLDKILPVEGKPVKLHGRWHGPEKSKGILIEADFPPPPPEPVEQSHFGDDGMGPFDPSLEGDWGELANSPPTGPSAEHLDEIAQRQSEETTSGLNDDEDAASSSENLDTTSSPASVGQIPIINGSSASEVEATPSSNPSDPSDPSDPSLEVLQLSTEGLKEFCRRVSLLDKTQDLMIWLDTSPWNWTASDQSEALLQARKTVIEAVVTSIESIPHWHRYCVQLGDLAVFASRKGGSSVTGSPDYRITSETNEDWRGDAQYRQLFDDLRIARKLT